MGLPYTLYLGDCLETLRTLPDNSVDSVVCDPPYGLSKEPDMAEVLHHWLAGDDYQHKGGGFMGKSWDSFVPGPAVWRECLRVLKPGGHLLAFFGTRTQDMGTLAIRLAGFEIRDSIAWIYGSGFPKSMDVSKAIDKAGGASPRDQAQLLRAKREAAGLTREQVADHCCCTPSSVRDWEEGRARAVGAPVEFIVPSVGYRAKLADLLGYSSDERRLIGSASDRRGDGTGYGLGHSGDLRSGGNTDAASQWQGWGTALKPALEPITVARKPLVGTVAANVLEHGTGALNIDGCRVAAPDGVPLFLNRSGDSVNAYGDGLHGSARTGDVGAGRWPANLIHDGSDEVLAAFPQASGAVAPVKGTEASAKTANAFGEYSGRAPSDQRDGGGRAARFFYCAKASRKDRNEGTASGSSPAVGTNATMREREDADWPARNGNHHPTVKPTDLMAYLCRLVTPPGGTVLDPFMGSGSTGKAAMREGFRFIGCELSPEYLAIAEARIAHELGKRVPVEPAPVEQAKQHDLFAQEGA
ncbi:hypothetical protein K32_48790 [Kaistia sp. 32K]|uniref:DNA methyltransferase n=1 Tax=Kaistia sp. 32K TaxID=2795690 RepID=UPI001916341F|nr:DNA methyltransferase [Kaistia sp. 32K]BCP56262.1 hypothetical protein K32_48790 [Kaistia sp. 32K]